MDKDLKDYTEEEYRKYFFTSKYYKSLNPLHHIMVWLGVYQYKFYKSDYEWFERRRFNPYHPLSYVYFALAAIIVPIGILISSIPAAINEIIDSFKYH